MLNQTEATQKNFFDHLSLDIKNPEVHYFKSHPHQHDLINKRLINATKYLWSATKNF